MMISHFKNILMLFDDTDVAIWKFLATGCRDQLNELANIDNSFILNEDFWVLYVSSVFEETEDYEIKNFIYKFYEINDNNFCPEIWRYIYIGFFSLKTLLNDDNYLSALSNLASLQYDEIMKNYEIREFLSSLHVNLGLFLDLLDTYLPNLGYYVSDETLKNATEFDNKQFLFIDFIDFKNTTTNEIKEFLSKKNILNMLKKYFYFKTLRRLRGIETKKLDCPICEGHVNIVYINELETEQTCKKCGYQKDFDGTSKENLELYLKNWNKENFL